MSVLAIEENWRGNWINYLGNCLVFSLYVWDRGSLLRLSTEVPSFRYKVLYVGVSKSRTARIEPLPSRWIFFFFFSVLLRWFVSASIPLSHSLSQGKIGGCFIYILQLSLEEEGGGGWTFHYTFWHKWVSFFFF